MYFFLFCFNLEGKLNLRFILFLLKVSRTFAFYIPWRKEDTLFRLDLGWPKYSEYFTGSTFSVAVDSLNGLVYVAQVSRMNIICEPVSYREQSVNVKI